MQPLKANSHWKMKDMRVEVKISTYPLLSDEHLESIMFSSDDKHLLRTLLLHAAQLPASHITSLYDASYHSVALMMKTGSAVDITLNCSTLPPQNPMGFAQQPLSKFIYTICDDLEEDVEEEDFQTVTLDDDSTGLQMKFQIDISVFMNIQYCTFPMSLPMSIYGLYLYIIPYDTFDHSYISEFKDLMTTSSDEDIPALGDEIGY